MTERRWYIPLFLLLVTAFVPFMKEWNRVGKIEHSERVKAYPEYTLEQIRTEMESVREAEHRWNVNPHQELFLAEYPGQYWEYHERRTKLVDAMHRYNVNPRQKFSAEVESRLTSLNTIPPTKIINYNFGQKFGVEVMQKARPSGTYLDIGKKIPDVPSNCSTLFVQGYLWSIPIMFLVFCIRLRVRELLIGIELWRLIPASVCWPIAMFIYPMDVKKKEQLKLALQVLSYGVSAMMSFCSFGVMPIKAQGQTQKNKTSSSQNESRVSVGYGVELYPVTTAGPDPGPLVSPWVFAKADLGKGFQVMQFSFVEVGGRKTQLFTNNTTSFYRNSWRGLMFSFEVGATPAGSAIQVSPRVNLVKLPWIGRNLGRGMKSLTSGHAWRVRGPTHFREYYVSWISKEIPLIGGLTIATEGMMRFRTAPAATVGQPQVLFRHKKVKHVDWLAEFWMIHADPTVRFGIQLHN